MKAEPRIMMLGAGIFQVPAIRKAAALGWHVITVDYLPDNVGHRYAARYVNCSTADRDGVLRAARACRIDGICTFGSDVAVPAVAHVCAELGLPGPSPDAADTLTSKPRFRACQAAHGLPAPRAAAARSPAALRAAAEALRFPVVLKPADSSGSRGVTRIEGWDDAGVEAAFAAARAFSRASVVCAEEWLEGVEVGGDGFLLDGRLVFAAVTEKHRAGFAVTGHRLPAGQSPAVEAWVREAVEAAARAAGYRDGPVNFDVMTAPGAATVIEMSPRCGGNGLPAVIERATGADLEAASLHFALGRRPVLPAAGVRRGAGSVVLGSPRSGVIRRMAPEASLRRAVPEVFDAWYARRTGERVERFVHGGDAVACAAFDCGSATGYARLAARIRDALGLDVA